MAKLKSGTRIYGTATIDTSVVVGSSVTANSSGIQVSGIVTATTFSGSGTNLTGIVTSIVAGTNITVSGSTGQVTINSSSSGGVSISTNTTNQAQYLTYATGTGTTTGLGVTITGLVFNPSTGNLGIGTTNPTTRITIGGTTGISFADTNIRIGSVSIGSSITSGTNNFFGGASAGQFTTTGLNNNFFGPNAGQCNVGGNNNNFFGPSAGQCNVGGLNNNFFGPNAGLQNGGGNNNNFFGSYAGFKSTGCFNNFFGIRAGFYNTTGCNNNFLGQNAGRYNSTGGDNNIFGSSAGYCNGSGCNNNFFGPAAGYFNTAGQGNNFFGNAAGQCSNGSFNNFLGTQAGRNTTGSSNNFFGYYAGRYNNSGNYNNFMGSSAGYCNTTGKYNNFFGQNAGYMNTTGSGSIAIGMCAGYFNTGIRNIYFGECAGWASGRAVACTTGSDNFLVGKNAGAFLASGSNSNFIGNQAGYNNVSGFDNNFFGRYAGAGNISGSYNNFLGRYSGYVSGSSYNVYIGTLSGCSMTGGCNVILGGFQGTGFAACNNHIFLSDGIGNNRAQFNNSGAFGLAGANYGTAGQVLTSSGNAAVPVWSSPTVSGTQFDTTIDNVLYVQPTGTLDIVGVGTTTSQITTLPAGTNEYIIHSLHVTNISNGDAEITAGFVMNARKVPAAISVSVGSSGGSGIHTFTVGSASSITVGMAVTGTGNIGETTGIGSTAGFQYNTYVTSVDRNTITLSKPMSGRATGTLQFSPVSLVSSRLPVPVGSAVELLKQPMILNALDSIVLQSTGAGTGIGSTSTAAISQTANSNILTVAAGAAITNFLSSGMLIQPTGSNTGIQTNTFVGVGYAPGSLSVPMTRPATVALASTSLSFTEVVVPQDGALQVTVVYQSSTDTSYQNGTGTVSAASSNTTSVTAGLSTIPVNYYSTGLTYPSIVQSIRVSNISDGVIYPGGDYPVSVGIGNSDTIFSWLAYNMVIPKNSSIELCEAPKRIGIGQSIFAFSNTPNAIEIQIAGKQKI